MVDAFAQNLNAAKQKYAGQNLALSAAVTGVDKGARPGTYELLLLDGGMRITVGGAAFNEDAYKKLYTAIRAACSAVKEDQKTREAFWDKLDRASAEKQEYTFYPVVSCIARIQNYRNKVVEIQQTIDLSVGYSTR